MISIIIINFNVSKHLFNCLSSLASSNENDLFEIIIVDNNSTEDVDIESKLNFFNQSIKFYKLNENKGFSKAVNFGIKKSNGDYVLLLNPDTLIDETSILGMSSFLDKNLDVGIVGCKVLYPNGDYQHSSKRHFPLIRFGLWRLLKLDKIFHNSSVYGRYNYTFHSHDDSLEVDAVSGACMMFRKTLLSEIGYFDEIFFLYFEDTDFCYRAKKKCKVIYNPDFSVIHIKGESFKNSKFNVNYEFFKSFYSFYVKYFNEYHNFYISKLFIKYTLKLSVFVLSLSKKVYKI